MDHFSAPVFRIIFEGRENYRVMDQEQNVFPAEVAGKVRNQSELWPAVGDWVIGRPQPGEWVLIEEVRERTSVLARRDPDGIRDQVLAANVDTLFIVTSANHDLNLNRLERYVALAVSGHVQPVIVVNKIELANDAHALLDSVVERFPAVDVHGMSVVERWNLESLDLYATDGRTVAFVGSSGVGKSSLTNVLLGKSQMLTQGIRTDDDRGRHTTTHRELHVTNAGAWVIDTPGLRQVGLTDDVELDAAFVDIEGLAARCKFTDCRHSTEPSCAIQTALADGTLALERWENYQKLKRELAFEQRKASKALQSQEKKRWAKIHMGHRAREKLRGR